MLLWRGWRNVGGVAAAAAGARRGATREGSSGRRNESRAAQRRPSVCMAWVWTLLPSFASLLSAVHRLTVNMPLESYWLPAAPLVPWMAPNRIISV